MAFKPAKSRSLALVRGSSLEVLRCGGTVNHSCQCPRNLEGFLMNLPPTRVCRAPYSNKPSRDCKLWECFKVRLLQFVLLPRMLWPIIIYWISLSVVEDLERKVNRYTRKQLGLPPTMSSVALHSRRGSLRQLPLRSVVEEYMFSKIKTQWMLNNSADSRIREVKPLLRSGRKF